MGIVQLSYAPTPAGLNVNSAYAIVDEAEFRRSQLFSLGSGSYVYNELRSGTNKEFDQFRRLGFVREFIIGSQPLNKVNKMRAEKASQEFIRLASERIHELGHVDDISPDSSCILVPYTGAIQPLPQSGAAHGIGKRDLKIKRYLDE